MKPSISVQFEVSDIVGESVGDGWSGRPSCESGVTAGGDDGPRISLGVMVSPFSRKSMSRPQLRHKLNFRRCRAKSVRKLSWLTFENEMTARVRIDTTKTLMNLRR